MLPPSSRLLVLCALTACVLLPAQSAPAAFPVFESGPVRPVALSPDGTRLFVANLPDHRLEIFAVDDGSLAHVASVAVGLEPVAVAARSDTEVWVVNHLSDSVSVVDVAADPPRVVRTLLVGDEPRDVVFAGPRDGSGRFSRAFVTTARRGQNLPTGVAPRLTTPGTPRALVWVFAADDPGAAAGGAPEAVVELFGDTPRALAATPDGATVYAAVFHSGNQTTTVTEGAVCNGGAGAGPCSLDGVQVAGGLANARVPGGLPAPNANVEGVRGPETGLIVKFDRDSGEWQDGLGRNWNNAVRFDLPDLDVFAIDALADPPAEVAAFPHVGTILFNMVVNPETGSLYVSNTEARNEVRFEGPGLAATTVRGHLHEARITVIDGDTVAPRPLNKHIAALPAGYRTTPMPAGVRETSLATPLQMALASDGTLYVAAFGSATIGRFRADEIEADTFVPDADDHIAVSGGGPAGLALDEANERLYVLTRFDNEVKVVDTSSRREIARHPLHTREAAHVVRGRRVLYDARATGSNGEASCASCHVFGDFDSLGWDLGNPDDVVVASFNPRGPIGSAQPFHPLKGPMTTQTLRGMAHHGPMHWRGDRTGAAFDGDPRAMDERLAFVAFNGAFPALVGRDEGELADADMEDFADFILAVRLPPNPVRSLDNQLSAAAARGRDIFLNRPGTDGIASCDGCHTLDPAQGFFGSGGRTTFENEPQEFKVAPLNNAYQKVGMFGMPDVDFVNLAPARRQHQGPQVRGFGYLHDGSIATIDDFLHASVFFLEQRDRTDLEQFTLAFDTTFAPIVGQQATLTATNGAAVGAALDRMRTRAATPFILAGEPQARECDLVARGTIDGGDRGFLFDPAAGVYRSDRATEVPLTDAALRALAASPEQELTFTCAPPGSGRALALDRDGDGYLDRDEIDAGADPADAASVPVEGSCGGDCDGDGVVTVDEILTGVNLALGVGGIDDCEAMDGNGDGAVTVEEILQAVGVALDGCASA
jgi:YVTN family beta-propeller protein